jgi:hypothetical protein
VDEGFERILACFHFPLTEAKMNQKSGGPRTPQGKERSKLNAFKYGLFSTVVVLRGESRAEYLSLLTGLQQDFQPQGTLETVLVESLAVLWWRKRRLYQAESAEISEKIKFTGSDSFANQYIEAWDLSRAAIASGGMLKYSNNLYVVRQAREMLVSIRGEITKPEFQEESRIFKKIYGEDQDGATPYGIPLFYEILKITAWQKEKSGDKPAAVMLREIMLRLVDGEIERLKELEEMLEAEERRRIKFKSVAAFVPGQEVSDRLLRVDAHLSREIEKVLNRLERLQRMRKGQPVPRPVDVNISA